MGRPFLRGVPDEHEFQMGGKRPLLDQLSLDPAGQKGHLPSSETRQRHATQERVRRFRRVQHRPLPDRVLPDAEPVFAGLQMADVFRSKALEVHTRRGT